MLTLKPGCLTIGLVAMLGVLFLPNVRASDASDRASDQAILQEILARRAILGRENREKVLAGLSGEELVRARNELWWTVVTEDFNEFDPYFPFRTEPARMLRPQLQMTEDKYQRIPPGRADRKPLTEKIKVYGDVAILTSASHNEGDPLTGGAYREQVRKNTMVWTKIDGDWKLAFCHCEWKGTLDGIGWLPPKMKSVSDDR